MVRPTPDQDDAMAGLLEHQPVATPEGWRRAGHLQPGDAVWCVDGPPQPLRWLRRRALHGSTGVLVPAAALGNPGAQIVLPDQSLALELDQAVALYGDPVVLLPAGALVGWRGIRPCVVPATGVIRLGFARCQVIYAGPGLLVGCEGAAPPVTRPAGPPAPPLTAGQAAHLMACLMAEEAGAVLRRQAARAAGRRA